MYPSPPSEKTKQQSTSTTNSTTIVAPVFTCTADTTPGPNIICRRPMSHLAPSLTNTSSGLMSPLYSFSEIFSRMSAFLRSGKKCCLSLCLQFLFGRRCEHGSCWIGRVSCLVRQEENRNTADFLPHPTFIPGSYGLVPVVNVSFVPV